MDELPSPLSMPIEKWVELLPKVKLSEMTYIKKLSVVRDACLDITYDMVYGHFKYQMNDKWYQTVLAVMRDCGFDTSSIETVDWNHLEAIVPTCDEICAKAEKILIPMPHNEWGRDLYVQQIICDS
ncbi:hypothetical protein [Succinimonas sp.]|uniref:hypothetical protein n=1 Tax=Succinimonas sp. TaxID=1936151 RepID=UPI00386533EF